MRKLFSGILILCLVIIIAKEPVVKSSAQSDFFADVNSSHPNYDSIKFFYDQAIIHGKEDGLFYPDDTISRVEALKVLFNAVGVSVIEELPEVGSFSDVASDTWYAPYVYLAKERNTVSGTEQGAFEPNRSIKNAETCKIILKTFDVEIEKIDDSYNSLHWYSDVPVRSWYAGCVGFSFFYGILDDSRSEFMPFKDTSRAAFVEFVYNLYQFKLVGNLAKINPNISYGETEQILAKEEDLSVLSETNLIPIDYQLKWEKLSSGIASFYGDEFNGKGTASGATFHNDKIMAAHPLLPFNSWVRVINLENNESIDVEILDCGPFVKGRVIDLSKTAFEQIGHTGSGLLNVELELLELGPKKWQDRCYELTQKRW